GATPSIQLGLLPKSISRVPLDSKKPPMYGVRMKSTPVLKVCLPTVLLRSSLNCHFRWMDCCGTLVLVPNCTALGKVTSGARLLLSIRLFQYCHPTVNWLIRLDENAEFKVRLAICM